MSQYFNEALHDFLMDFNYGRAIRHLVNIGYDTDRIIREFDYPLSRDVIEKMVQKQKDELKKEHK